MSTDQHDAQSGKALAIWLFNIGAATPEQTAAKFAANPTWRVA